MSTADYLLDRAIRDLTEKLRREVIARARNHIQSGGATTYDPGGSTTPLVSTTVQAALDELDALIAAHLADALDSHDASSISVVDVADNYTGTDVEAILAEIADLITGGALTVEDDGTPLAGAALVLDFVGAGVQATGAGADKTILIPGGATPDDARAWMPLTSVVAGEPVLVWDADDSLIPTLVPF